MKFISRGAVFLMSAWAIFAISNPAFSACDPNDTFTVNGFMKDPVRVSSDPAGRKKLPVSAFEESQEVSACAMSSKGELPLKLVDGSGSVFVKLRYLKTTRSAIDCFKPVLGKQMARDHSTPGANSKCK